MSDAKYAEAVAAVELRSEIHRLEFQPRAEARLAGQPAEFSLDDLERAAGPRLTLTMRRATDDIYAQVDAALAALATAGQLVPSSLKSVFPGRAFISFGLPIPRDTAQ